MQFQDYTQRLEWRATPGNGVAVVGSHNTTYMVVAVNPSLEEIERLTRRGADLHIMPEADAAAIDGRDWYDDADAVPLPPSARRLRRPPSA